MSFTARVTALLVIVVVAAAALFIDASAERPDAAAEPSPSPVALDTPDRGSAYCVPLTTDDETAQVTVAAPEAPSSVQVIAGGEVVADGDVDPGEPLVVALEGERAAAPVTLRWEGAPAVAMYETLGDAPQVVAACPTTTEPRWHLPGYTTTLGNQASLHLYNPFSVDAVAQVRYATPAGAVDLVTTQDLAVPAGEAVTVDIDEVQPEVADLGVIVDVLTGRLVAAGQMRFGPPDEDTPAPTGRTSVTAVGEPALQQTFAYGAAAEDRADTWLSLMNPDMERDALVTVGVSAPDPDAEVTGEITVPAGGTVRVPLAGRSERRTFASSVQVLNEVPVVGARVATRTDTVDDELLDAVDVATAGTPGTEWLALPSTAGRTSVIDVYNASGGDVTVELAPLGPVDGQVPDEWASTVIEANGQRGFGVTDLAPADGQAVMPVRVTADGPVVVSVRWADEPGAVAGFRTLVGFSPDSWAGLQQRPSLRLAPSLDRNPLPSPSPTVTPLPEPSPTPTPEPDPDDGATQAPATEPPPTEAPAAPTDAPDATPSPEPTS